MAPPALQTLLLVLLCANTGLGGSRCELPPSAWCRSWDTALRCGAVGVCAQRGWSQSTQQDDTCTDCQDLVTLLIRMANVSAAKAAVGRFLRRECEALPVPTMVTPCQSLVSRYWELLEEQLGGQLKPSAICARLELCPVQPGGVPAVSPHIGALLQDAALPVPLPLCWLCRTFLSRAEAAVPKGAVAGAVSQLCRALPLAVSGACQCLAERYTVLVLDALLGKLAPRLVCSLMLHCGPERDGGNMDVTATGNNGDTRREDPTLWQVLTELTPNLELSPNLKLTPNLELSPKPGLTPKPGPCALGPAYWCSSAETARRCEAQLYCQDHAGL